MNWESVYKFPLELNFDNKVMTSNFEMAFDFIPEYIKDIEVLHLALDDKLKIVRIINGSNERMSNCDNFSYKNGVIFINELAIIWIRGWSNLTGQNGLNLDKEEAIKIQDDFGNYIVSCLVKFLK